MPQAILYGRNAIPYCRKPTPFMSHDHLHTIPETTKTHLLGGRVILLQPAKGYRAGMDAALLAAACADLMPDGRALRGLELGCGAGAALLSLKARCPSLHLVGIERDKGMAELAHRNVSLNAASNIGVIEGDVANGFGALGSERFDLVFSNPPYFDDPTALRAPEGQKRGAWIADDGLQVWLDFALAAVKDGGHIVFIHRADRLADLLGGLSAKAGSFTVLPIQPYADEPAKRVIVIAKRLGKAPLRLLPALVLHDRSERKHTPLVEAILRGDAPLAIA